MWITPEFSPRDMNVFNICLKMSPKVSKFPPFSFILFTGTFLAYAIKSIITQLDSGVSRLGFTESCSKSFVLSNDFEEFLRDPSSIFIR